MSPVTVKRCAVIAIASAPWAACAAEPEPPSALCEPPAIDPSGETRAYYVSEVDMPSDASDAAMLGLDLDRDEQGRPDNALGYALGAVFQFREDELDDSARSRIESGELVQLLEIQSVSLEEARGVGLTVSRGRDLDADPSDNASGSERFGVVQEGAAPLAGAIEDGVVDARFGSIPLEIALPGSSEPFVLELIGARFVGEVDEDGLQGKLGGALTEEDIEDVLIPMAHQALQAAVEEDCAEGACVPDSFGELVLEAYDVDGDGALDLAEVRDNDLTRALVRPDIDFVDGEGRVGCGDGVKDSLSFGVGITAVPAEIRRP